MKIEIFEEDGNNVLSLDDKYADFTIDIYPDSKTYESRMRLKDDVYYRTEKFEYRIKTDPIGIEKRLVERVDEPPEEYKVKDGVVLESEIAKNNKFLRGDFVDGLKKEVEWHEDWIGNPISMYILSKHSEIISPEDYRRYLRQLSERVKTAILKIEKALESDKTKLQIIDDEFGLGVWYPKDKLDKLEDEELEKLREHATKFQEVLFNEKDEKYVGLSEGEFRSSKDILENIEAFLNKKPASIKKEGQRVSFGIKLVAFILQWVWLFIVVSIALWLLSLAVSIIQYSFVFTFLASGILAFFFTILRGK